jgi:hypothetical protein
MAAASGWLQGFTSTSEQKVNAAERNASFSVLAHGAYECPDDLSLSNSLPLQFSSHTDNPLY